MNVYSEYEKSSYSSMESEFRPYYAVSPTLVKWFGHTDWFRKFWKGRLDKMVNRLNARGVEDTPYQDRNW